MIYFAIVRDEVVLSGFTLPEVLDLLADIHEAGEDVAVWQGHRVAAVVHGDGRVTTFEAAPAEAA